MTNKPAGGTPITQTLRSWKQGISATCGALRAELTPGTGGGGGEGYQARTCIYTERQRETRQQGRGMVGALCVYVQNPPLAPLPPLPVCLEGLIHRDGQLEKQHLKYNFNFRLALDFGGASPKISSDLK